MKENVKNFCGARLDKIKSIGCLQKMIEMDNCYKYGCENVKDLKTNLQNFEL